MTFQTYLITRNLFLFMYFIIREFKDFIKQGDPGMHINHATRILGTLYFYLSYSSAYNVHWSDCASQRYLPSSELHWNPGQKTSLIEMSLESFTKKKNEEEMEGRRSLQTCRTRLGLE